MATAKKTVKRKVNRQNIIPVTKDSIVASNEIKKSFSPRKLIIIVLLIVLAILAFRYKNLFVVGMVNNQPITSFELNQRMTDAYGKQTLDQVITERLLRNEAKKRNITVSQTEIDDELKNVEASLGGVVSLDEALAQQGMTRDQLKDQVELRLIVSKLVDENVTISEEEVDKYIEANKEFVKADSDPVKTKNDIRNYLKEQKINEQVQLLIRELKEKAKIVTFI